MPSQENTSSERPGAEEREIINSRYEVLRVLGQGGMGAVFLARDRHRGGKEVALKRVRADRADEKTLTTIRNEFLALADLRHPNVAEAYDFGIESASRDIFFTAEFVHGSDWMTFAKSLDLSREEDSKALYHSVIGVLRGLEFIHSQGMVHLDLKPDNVVVGVEGETYGLPKLIDFGLAKREGEFGGKRIMGTTYYIAPETILGARADRRTDLYSFGVVLYHLLTGELPFRGKNNIDVFKGHLEGVPQPPHERASTVPRQLSTIVLCLMEKKPADRYQSALEVIDELNRELGLEQRLETETTALSYLHSASTPERDEELERLYSVFTQATKLESLAAEGGELASHLSRSAREDREVVAPSLPSGRAVVLRGEEGIGKRVLKERLSHRAKTQGCLVLEIECAGEENDTFQLARELVAYGAQVEGSGGGNQIARLGIELARREAKGEEFDVANPPAELSELATGMLEASCAHPYLAIVHDLHEAGPLVASFVHTLVEKLDGGVVIGARGLLLGSTLDQADTEGTIVESLYASSVFRRASLELRLERLDGDNVARLIEAAFYGSQFPSTFVDRVLEESDGNPAVVREILSFFVREDLVSRTPVGWLLRPDYFRRSLPGSVRDRLKETIESLGDDAGRLAIAFALLGHGSEADLAIRVSGLPEKAGVSALAELRREKLLQGRAEGDSDDIFSFVHSSARRILYESIPAEKRAEEHERAGRLGEVYFKEREREDPRRLAEHFLKAGSRAEGIKYGLLAAESFVGDFTPLEAIRTYEAVLRLASGDAAVETRVRREVAALRYEVGDYELVVDVLDPLLESDEVDGGLEVRSEIALWMAKARGRLGLYKQAAAHTQEVVEWQHAETSQNVLGELLLACADLHAGKGNLVECLRCCERLLSRPAAYSDPDIASRLYVLLAESHFRLDNQEAAVQHAQEALRTLETQRDERYPDVNLFCLARFYKYKGKLTRAARQFEIAGQVSRKLGAADRRADALVEMGTINQWLERPQPAIAALSQAKALYQRTGNVPGGLNALCGLGETHRLLGEYEEAKDCLSRAFRAAETLSNRYGRAQALVSYAGICLDQGDIQAAERYLSEAQSSDFRLSGVVLLKAHELRFQLSAECGDLGAALEQAGKALGANRGSGDDRIATAKLVGEKALLLCRLGKRMEARRALVSLLEVAKSANFPLCEGRARMLEGVLLAKEGKAALAEKSFGQAAEIFRNEGCERELVRLYLEHGFLSLREGDFENTYLCLEEGFYLAKKLNLAYMKCRYYFAMAVLEMAIPDGQYSKAEERFRFAEQLASKVPYRELLWQIQSYLAKLYELAGRETESGSYAAKSLASRKLTTDMIPLTYRQAYLKAADDKKLEELIEARVATPA
ncbi:MAG: protein kinase [Planctomycetota bacterium]